MVFENIEEHGCEEVAFFYDKSNSLKAIIAIHDTTLGPAWGGTRLWNYGNEKEALIDVLRLARGMTYKASVSDLDLGGGKAVILAKPEEKREALLRSYGRFVETFGGRFITGEDVGIGVEDVKIMCKETRYVVGISEKIGDPSPYTARGVLSGIRACTKAVFGTSNLSGMRVAIQGVGHVGSNLARALYQAGATVTVADVKEENVNKVTREVKARIVSPTEILSLDCDIFAPCALGAILNSQTIRKLKCKIVAGAANNQLERSEHGRILYERGICYAPDYAINAGGMIAIYLESRGNTLAQINRGVEKIEQRIASIIVASKERNQPTHEIADKLAEERISAKKRLR